MKLRLIGSMPHFPGPVVPPLNSPGGLIYYLGIMLRNYSFQIAVIIIVLSLMGFIIFWIADYHNLTLQRWPLTERAKFILILDVVALFLVIVYPRFIIPGILKWMGYETFKTELYNFRVGNPTQVETFDRFGEAFIVGSNVWFAWVLYILISIVIAYIIWSIISIVYYSTIEGEAGLEKAKFLLIRNTIGIFIVFLAPIFLSTIPNLFPARFFPSLSNWLNKLLSLSFRAPP